MTFSLAHYTWHFLVTKWKSITLVIGPVWGPFIFASETIWSVQVRSFLFGFESVQVSELGCVWTGSYVRYSSRLVHFWVISVHLFRLSVRVWVDAVCVGPVLPSLSAGQGQNKDVTGKQSLPNAETFNHPVFLKRNRRTYRERERE